MKMRGTLKTLATILNRFLQKFLVMLIRHKIIAEKYWHYVCSTKQCEEDGKWKDVERKMKMNGNHPLPTTF